MPPIRTPPAKAASPAEQLPAWYPAWARELADLYFSGTTCLFILHGNVHDLIHCPDGGEDAYCSLAEFLTTQVFGTLGPGAGLRSEPRAAAAGRPRRRAAAGHAAIRSRPAGASRRNWPRDPDPVLLLLDAFIERNLVDEAAVAEERGHAVRLRPVPASRRATWTRWSAARRRGWSASCAGRRIR